jgi:hypothetical protein
VGELRPPYVYAGSAIRNIQLRPPLPASGLPGKGCLREFSGRGRCWLRACQHIRGQRHRRSGDENRDRDGRAFRRAWLAVENGGFDGAVTPGGQEGQETAEEHQGNSQGHGKSALARRSGLVQPCRKLAEPDGEFGDDEAEADYRDAGANPGEKGSLVGEMVGDVGIGRGGGRGGLVGVWPVHVGV